MDNLIKLDLYLCGEGEGLSVSWSVVRTEGHWNDELGIFAAGSINLVSDDSAKFSDQFDDTFVMKSAAVCGEFSKTVCIRVKSFFARHPIVEHD